jgi:hypothetical protein
METNSVSGQPSLVPERAGSGSVVAAAGAGADRARRHAERDLGAAVVAIEFTLISVMVGVVLFPLMESATVLLHDREYQYWPYIAAGCLLVLYLWAAVIGHSLTFIGWPIDFGHNLLYIVLALVLAIAMHFLSDPVAWFALTPVAAAVAALTVYYDLRVIRQRLATAGGAAAGVLAAALEQQHLQLRLAPVYVLVALVPLALVLGRPDIFLDRGGHLVLIAAQTAAIAGALFWTIRTFNAWTPLILRRTMDDLAAGATP